MRIGVSLIKGIAFGRNIPCVAVSTLEALAENITPLSGVLVPCMDARRGQLYTALFASNGIAAERLSPDSAISIKELADELIKQGNKDIYLSGDGYEVAKKTLLSLGVKTKETPPLLITENAYSVARVALRKYNRGEYMSDTEITATYLRLPQAERERLENLKKKDI